MFTCSPKAFAAPAKCVTISYMSSWEWAMKAVSSANMSSRTRMGLVLVVDLNWFTLNKFAPSLDWIVTPLSQPADEQSRTLERKREKRVGAKTQPYFNPFCTSKGLDSSPFRLREAFMSLCREAMRLTNRSRQRIFCSIFQSVFLCTVSNAFVKSVNTMCKGLLCSMHFYWICLREKIMSTVPCPGQKPHTVSVRTFSLTKNKAHSLL